MNRKQLQSLFSAGVISVALWGSVAHAEDDMPMDPATPGAKQSPMGNSMAADKTAKTDTTDMSMPTDTKGQAKPAKKHKKHPKSVDKGMAQPAGSGKMGNM